MAKNSVWLRPYLRPALIAFSGGAVASLLAGAMTGGLAAAYALLSLWVCGIVGKVGGESLANTGWLNILVTAVGHGLAFLVIVSLARLAFPKLAKEELGGTVLLVATVAYGLVLAVPFPVRT